MILIGPVKKSNIYILMFYRLSIAMFMFSICRIGFFLFNHKMFPGMNLAEFLYALRGGLVFDLSAIVYINIIFILLCILPFDFRYNDLYQKIMKYLFLITNGIAISMNGMDFVYYKFIGKRATSDVFGTFSNETHVFKMFFRFLVDYWQATIFTLFLLAFMIYLYNKITTAKPSPEGKLRRFIISFIMMPVIAFLVIGAARGGYKHSTRPITISNAAKYVQNPEDVAIVLNTPFSIMRTYGKKALTDYHFFDRGKLNSIYNTYYTSSKDRQFRNENVVIIILESFAREYIGAYNHELEDGKYTGYTPFIDSLINESLTFDVSVSNGRKSIDAMPSILASIPSLETPYIISHYANNQINGLPALLKKKGYYTAFFHGAPNGSMGFDSFAKLAGFDDYFGLDQYPEKDDFDGMWGVWDEPFLKFFASKLDSFHEPFMASVFTISSHHPFEVPSQYKGKFKKGPAPIVEVVGYTDYALKEFFKKVSQSKWFNNTLFVITADHTNESSHKEYQNDYGVYSIPVIFYRPGSNLKGVKNRIAQQIDIMPTVLNYLNYDGEYVAFGNDLLNDSIESFAFNTNGSTYHIYMRDHLLEMIDNKSVSLFNYRQDKYLQNNLLDKDPVLQKIMEEKLHAIMQTYNSRLIHNDMTVKQSISESVR